MSDTKVPAYVSAVKRLAGPNSLPARWEVVLIVNTASMNAIVDASEKGGNRNCVLISCSEAPEGVFP